MKYPLMALTLLVSFCWMDASAATVSRLTLKELGSVSQLVFIGTVKAQSVEYEKSPLRIFTKTVFAVDDVLKGSHKGDYTLVQLGGAIGAGDDRMVQAVPGYPRFHVGERVVLFLEQTMAGTLVVTGLAQGKFLLLDTESGLVARQAQGDIHHPTMRGVADVHLEGAARLDRPIPMAQLKAIIQGKTPLREPLRLRYSDGRTPRVNGTRASVNRGGQ